MATTDNINGVVTPVCIGGSAGNRIYGTHPYDGYGPPPPVNNPAPPPVIQKPSSYGAVAENKKTGLIVGASKQASKQASILHCKNVVIWIIVQSPLNTRINV